MSNVLRRDVGAQRSERASAGSGAAVVRPQLAEVNRAGAGQQP